MNIDDHQYFYMRYLLNLNDQLSELKGYI